MRWAPRVCRPWVFSTVPTTMGLARRQRNSLQDDLTTYQEIVKRSKELEKDIPPRFSTSARRKSLGKKRGPKVKRGKVVKEEVTEEVRELAKQLAGERVPRARKPVVPMTRPSFMARPTPIAVRTRDSASFLRSKVHTFEHQVCTNNSYDDMVRMARGLCASGEVDFGLALRLLPKRVEVERKRYTVRNQEADRLLEAVEAREALVSNDLDELFRKWSDMPVSPGENMHALPLI